MESWYGLEFDVPNDITMKYTRDSCFVRIKKAGKEPVTAWAVDKERRDDREQYYMNAEFADGVSVQFCIDAQYSPVMAEAKWETFEGSTDVVLSFSRKVRWSQS